MIECNPLLLSSAYPMHPSTFMSPGNGGAGGGAPAHLHPHLHHAHGLHGARLHGSHLDLAAHGGGAVTPVKHRASPADPGSTGGKGRRGGRQRGRHGGGAGPMDLGVASMGAFGGGGGMMGEGGGGGGGGGGTSRYLGVEWDGRRQGWAAFVDEGRRKQVSCTCRCGERRRSRFSHRPHLFQRAGPLALARTRPPATPACETQVWLTRVYATEEEAARARDREVIRRNRHGGERLNFPEEAGLPAGSFRPASSGAAYSSHAHAHAGAHGGDYSDSEGLEGLDNADDADYVPGGRALGGRGGNGLMGSAGRRGSAGGLTAGQQAAAAAVVGSMAGVGGLGVGGVTHPRGGKRGTPPSGELLLGGDGPPSGKRQRAAAGGYAPSTHKDGSRSGVVSPAPLAPACSRECAPWEQRCSEHVGTADARAAGVRSLTTLACVPLACSRRPSTAAWCGTRSASPGARSCWTAARGACWAFSRTRTRRRAPTTWPWCATTARTRPTFRPRSTRTGA